MAKAIWQGSITFGLVDIPIGLHPADNEHDLDLTMLDKRNFSPVGYRRFNKATGKEVEWSQIVRGYEYEKGAYVVLSDADLKRASPELTKEIAIESFVDREEIDPMLYDKPYYASPLRKNRKSYALLVETLARTGKVGISSLAIRTREHLAMIEARDGVLVVHTLRYPDEVRTPEDVGISKIGKAGLAPKEIQMAVQILEGMTESFKPSKHSDRYRKSVMKLVKQKIAAGAIHEITPDEKPEREPAKGGKIIDLMPLLRQSLERSGGKKAPARKKSTKRAAGERASRRKSA